jgi:hypothetical protein
MRNSRAARSDLSTILNNRNTVFQLVEKKVGVRES